MIFFPQEIFSPAHKAPHQMGFRHLFSFGSPMCKIVRMVTLGFAGQRPLASTLSLKCYLHSPTPCTPTLNPSSSCSELKTYRKPEPSVSVRLLALALSGSTAARIVRSQVNMYLTGIMKIETYKVQLFEKYLLPLHQRAH